MTPAIRRTGLLAAAVCLAASAWAAPTLTQRKPGLWEVQTTTAGAGMPQAPNMKDMMANLPPEQRARVEQMMKDQGVGMGARPNSFRMCLSKEQAEKNEMSVQPDPDTHCDNTMTPVSSREAKFTFQCRRKDGSTMKGEGRAYDLTPESYAMDLRMTVQQHQGAPMTMQTAQRGKWVGADCKGLKPIGGS